MTTDVSHKASPEDGQEGLPQPKKPPLADASGPGPEPGGKVGLLNHRPVAMDAGDSADQSGEWKDKETPRAGPTEPMDTSEATIRHSDLERTPPLLPGRPPRDRGPESRPTELSLEELSISARQQPTPLTPAQLASAPATTIGTRAGGHPEEPLPRLSRKRKLLEDTESGKTLLLDAYRVWQQGQKGVAYDLGRVERIMSETYMLIKQVGGGQRPRGTCVLVASPLLPFYSQGGSPGPALGLGFRCSSHPVPHCSHSAMSFKKLIFSLEGSESLSQKPYHNQRRESGPLLTPLCRASGRIFKGISLEIGHFLQDFCGCHLKMAAVTRDPLLILPPF